MKTSGTALLAGIPLLVFTIVAIGLQISLLVDQKRRDVSTLQSLVNISAPPGSTQEELQRHGLFVPSYEDWQKEPVFWKEKDDGTIKDSQHTVVIVTAIGLFLQAVCLIVGWSAIRNSSHWQALHAWFSASALMLVVVGVFMLIDSGSGLSVKLWTVTAFILETVVVMCAYTLINKIGMRDSGAPQPNGEVQVQEEP